MQIINDENFKELVLEAKVPVLVDFFADWCGPCKMMAPVVEELANELGDKAKVYKINVDDSPETAETYGIMSIPTFMVFKDGAPVKTQVGGMPKSALAAMME